MARNYVANAKCFAYLGAVLLCSLLALTACGGSGGAPTPAVAAADSVETGKPIHVGDWEVQLIKAPEQIKIIGAGNITYQASGNYLVVFLKVKNQGSKMQLIPRDLLTVRDEQGQEYAPVKSAVQVAFVLQQGMDLSLDSPLAADETRDSVIIYDIPGTAKGLLLTMRGANETLKLGF